MTDLAVPTDPQVPQIMGPPDASEWELLERQAETLAKSQMIPKDLRGKPHEIIVIALTARELRVPVMQALNKIHVIEGKPSMSAELMVALIMRAGHGIRVLESTNEIATVGYRRKEWPEDQHGEFSWTIDDARKAGLLDVWWERWNSTSTGKNWKETWTLPESVTDLADVTLDMLTGHGPPDWVLTQGPGQAKGKDNWFHYPKAMLWARAISQVARMQYADVLMGVSLTPEELGEEIDPVTGEVVNQIADQPVRDSLLARARNLNTVSREQLKNWFREYQCPPIARLPSRWVEAVDRQIAEYEQWTSIEEGPDLDPATAVDAEGTVTTTHRNGDGDVALVEKVRQAPTVVRAVATAEAVDPEPVPEEVEVVQVTPVDESGIPDGETAVIPVETPEDVQEEAQEVETPPDDVVDPEPVPVAPVVQETPQENGSGVTAEDLFQMGSVETIVNSVGMGTLRNVCKGLELSTSGTKPEMALRILDARPFDGTEG